MPDIIIHVEDFPGNCQNCPLCYDCCACTVTGKRIWHADIDPGTERLPDCPVRFADRIETFADEIRAMSDEKMADWLTTHDLKCYWEGHLSKKGYLEYLRQRSKLSQVQSEGETKND